jgi:antitoxin FitA
MAGATAGSSQPPHSSTPARVALGDPQAMKGRLRAALDGKALALDMWRALSHVLHMSKMIQIRNVPDDVHRALKIRATKEGMSLSEYLLREVTKVAAKPSLEEVMERIRRRGPVGEPFDSAAAVREIRGR